jgi:hypothetical protein
VTEQQQACLDIISSVYTDGVDAIGEPETSDDGSIVTCQFQDGAKLLEAKIFLEKEEDDIEIRMVGGSV